MDPEEFYRILRQQPFEPVRVHVSDGSSYEIRHPDQVVLSRRSAHIGIGPGNRGPFQDIAIVSNIHITRLEPLERRSAGKKP